jgi:nitrogen fixation protein NifQ
MTTPTDLYCHFMNATQATHCNAFDAHVVASAFAMGWQEAQGDPTKFLEALGLDPELSLELIRRVFPSLEASFAGLFVLDPLPTPSESEACLRQLLTHRASSERISEIMAVLVARRAQRPNHLWQDLGLRSRKELGWLMQRHFPSLAEKNATDMKWKKFLYRVICRDEQFSLCFAPSCEECSDFDGCFGSEDGEPLLDRKVG